MKKTTILILYFMASFYFGFAQDILNPYYDYSIQNPDYPTQFTNPNSGVNINLKSDNLGNTGYTGEYEIFVKTINSGVSPSPYSWGQLINTSDFAMTFKIESVSFPFTPECASALGGCGSGATSQDLYERKLFLPTQSFNPITRKWGDLSCETYSPGTLYTVAGFADWSHQTLVTQNYTCNSSIGINLQAWNAVNRTVLPHTILKHTVYVHCDASVYSEKIDSLFWYYDNTRGQMRYYPFCPVNSESLWGGSSGIYDILFIPKLYQLFSTNHPLNLPTNNNLQGPTGIDHLYSENHKNYFSKYDTPNNFIFDKLTDICSLPTTILPGLNEEYYFHPIYIAPNMLLSAPARLYYGKFLAGFDYQSTSNISKIPGIMHEYYIDKGYPELDLNWINPHEKVIFNPSDVVVGPKAGNSNLVNLIFPAKYTFKTILGIYPSVHEAEQANTAANGGPYDYLKDVPVPVNASELMPLGANPNDYPDVSSYDDPNTGVDERYGNYTMNEHSKITVEECVKIFDVIFYVNQGATLQFNNYPSVLNEERFKILWGGGAILKNYSAIQYAQNGVITQDYELKYIALNEIQAGNNVDPDPASAQNDYTIEPGNTDVKFEAGNIIRLEPGFSAKEGSSFSAKCHPISYPTSLCASPPNTGNRLASALGSGSKAVQALLSSNSNSALRISPNPGTGIFSVQLQNTKEAFTFEVSDVYGRKVLSSKGNSTENKIDLSEQPQGIYIVSANLDGKQWVEKIIKE